MLMTQYLNFLALVLIYQHLGEEQCALRLPERQKFHSLPLRLAQKMASICSPVRIPVALYIYNSIDYGSQT
jgi:hypothetical protein